MAPPRAALAVALSALALAGCGPRGEPEPVYVGHLLPLSGPDRARGEQARHGVLLAVKKARDEGVTVNGRPVAVRHVDTRGEDRLARAETVRLLTVNKVVALIAGPEAALADPVVRAARPYNVALVVPAELADPASAGEGVLALGASPAYRGEVLARHGAGGKKGRRAAVVSDSRDSLASALADAFGREWSKAGGTLGEWTFAADPDFAALAEKVKAWKPDVVLVAAAPRLFGRLAARLREGDVPGALFYGGEDVGVEGVRREAEGDVTLATALPVGKPSGSWKEFGDFAQRFREQFQEAPGLDAMQAYDATRLLIDTLKDAQSTQRKRLQEDLGKRTSFDSLTGRVWWEERRPRRTVFVVTAGKGGAKLVKAATPEGP